MHPTKNDGARMLRRGYNFVDGSDALGGLDAGLFFIAFVRDPDTQFIPLQNRMAQMDALMEYLKFTSSALFAVPPGRRPRGSTSARRSSPERPLGAVEHHVEPLDAVATRTPPAGANPSAPVGSSQPMVEVLAGKYGVPRDQAVAMMTRTEGLAADEGLVMHMETTLHSNTVDAHRLLHLALETDGPDAQKRLNAALVTAHFEHGEDVADHAVLTKVASSVGLDPAGVEDVLTGDRYTDAVAADVLQARAYGATGVPFFVIDQRYGVSGAQPTEVFAQVLEQAWSESASAESTPGSSCRGRPLAGPDDVVRAGGVVVPVLGDRRGTSCRGGRRPSSTGSCRCG